MEPVQDPMQPVPGQEEHQPHRQGDAGGRQQIAGREAGIQIQRAAAQAWGDGQGGTNQQGVRQFRQELELDPQQDQDQGGQDHGPGHLTHLAPRGLRGAPEDADRRHAGHGHHQGVDQHGGVTHEQEEVGVGLGQTNGVLGHETEGEGQASHGQGGEDGDGGGPGHGAAQTHEVIDAAGAGGVVNATGHHEQRRLVEGMGEEEGDQGQSGAWVG